VLTDGACDVRALIYARRADTGVFSDRWCDVSYRSDVPRSETIRIPQSCPWVGLTHGLGLVGSGWIEIFQFLVGWIGLGWVDNYYSFFIAPYTGSTQAHKPHSR